MQGHIAQLERRLQESLLGLARDNKAAEIHALIAAHGLGVTYGNEIGQTALHIAGVWGAVEAGEALLDHGAEINAQNELDGSTREPATLQLSRMRHSITNV
jgi:ankyrin repeat protein